MNPVPRRRSTSLICGSIWPGSAPGASCSRCGCPARASRCTGPTPPRDRRRSWRGTSRPSRCWAGHQPTRSATTTSRPRSPGCSSAATAPSRPAGWRSGSRHGFDAFCCKPGVEGAHEKGGVEGEGGRFRRNHLVPVPAVATMAELNERLVGYDLADDHRRIGNRTLSIGQHFALEADLLRPLPGEVFETGLSLTPRVAGYPGVTARRAPSSAPPRLIGPGVRAVLRASELLLSQGRAQVARHERATVRGSQSLNLDHYLEVLVRKPGASGRCVQLKLRSWLISRPCAAALGGRRALSRRVGGRRTSRSRLHRVH